MGASCSSICEKLKLLYYIELKQVDKEFYATPLQRRSSSKQLFSLTKGNNLDNSNTSEMVDEDHPLVLVINEKVPYDIVATLISILRRGNTLNVKYYNLLLPKRADKIEMNHKVQLICIGFDKDQIGITAGLGGDEVHTKAQERRYMYSFIQSISINGTTKQGGKIWSWSDHHDEAKPNTNQQQKVQHNNIPVPAPDNPTRLLDLCIRKHIISRLFFRHHETERGELDTLWKKRHSINISEELSNKMCSYLGPEIALYFEFLNFYTRALLIPTFFGLLFFLFGNTDDPRWWIGLSLITAIWSSFFIGWWSSYKIDKCNSWTSEGVGMYTNHSRVDDLAIKAAREAAAAASESSREHTILWRRFLSGCVSIILLATILKFDFFLLQWKTSNDLWLSKYDGADVTNEKSQPPLSFLMSKYYSLIPTVTKAISINIFGIIVEKVTSMQVKFESHTNPVKKRNSLVLKLCSFHFVTNFLYLYYYAFIEGDLSKLKSSLMTVLIVSFTVQNATETGLPWLLQRINFIYDTKNISRNPNTKQIILIRSKMRIDYDKPEYNGTFFDFLELFIQYGHVTLFVSVFPFGAFLALLNNVLEQRNDMFKILNELNPQLPSSSNAFVKNRHHPDESYLIIDVWINAFNIISYLAVATNIALLTIDDSQSSSHYVSKLNILSNTNSKNYNKDYTWAETVLILFFVEHVIFVLKWFLGYVLEHDDDVEDTYTNPQKHFAEAALKHHELASVSSNYDVNGSALTKAKNLMNDLFDDTIRRNIIKIIKEQDKRIEMAEKQRDEAIAWTGEVVPSEIIKDHFRQSMTPKLKKIK